MKTHEIFASTHLKNILRQYDVGSIKIEFTGGPTEAVIKEIWFYDSLGKGIEFYVEPEVHNLQNPLLGIVELWFRTHMQQTINFEWFRDNQAYGRLDVDINSDSDDVSLSFFHSSKGQEDRQDALNQIFKFPLPHATK